MFLGWEFQTRGPGDQNPLYDGKNVNYYYYSLVFIIRENNLLKLLKLFYCNGNIFLEGTSMVVIARRKWLDFLELTSPAERITLSAQVTRQSRRQFSYSCEFSQDVLVFKPCCSLQLRENNELGVNPSENFAAVQDNSRRNMLLPISVNSYCLNFDHDVSIRTTLLKCILLGEICCCLYMRICAVLTQIMRCTIEFAVLYKCWKNCWMNPHVSALFAVFLTEKWTGFPKRCFSPKRFFQIFFSIHTTPIFFSCK